ncbi:neuropeptide FF receptor 2-like [Lingula anatina]|nr:neuropeptide FF receptor 2-like [Lingula anatina]|eukprot:XP_013418124.2 neuropeptide FF receptor 2-like [Lingula anatina]
MGVSIYSLVAICAVRYACIAYPLYVHSALGRKTAYIASGLTWVAMLILNSPIPVIMLEDAGRRCTSRDKTNTVYYIYAFVIVGADFALPLSVIAVLSVLIIYRLRSMRDVQRRMSQYQVTCASPSMHHASKSATKRVMALVLLVVAVFLICWTPGMVLFLWNIITVLGPDSSVVSGKTSCHQRGVMYIVQDIAAIMAFSSSSLNPLVYNFGSEEFRKAFVQALTPRHMLRNRRRSSASASGIGMIRRCEFSARRTRSNRRSEV